MKKGIRSFVSSKKSSRRNTFEREKSKIEPENKRGQRELEMQMLKPTPLPSHTGDVSHVKGIWDRTVKIVFSSKEAFNLFGKYFTVGTYREQNCREVKLLELLLQELESGNIRYKKGRIKYAKHLRDRKSNRMVRRKHQKKAL